MFCCAICLVKGPICLLCHSIVHDTVLLAPYNGNVGIGTTIPTSRLHIIGDTRVGINTSQGVILTSENGTRYRLFVSDAGVLSTISV